MMTTETNSDRQPSNIRYCLKCAICGRDLMISNSCINKEQWQHTDEVVCEISPCRCQTRILNDVRNAVRAMMGMDDEHQKRIIAVMRDDEAPPQTREEMLAEVSRNTGLPLDSEPKQPAEAQK